MIKTFTFTIHVSCKQLIWDQSPPEEKTFSIALILYNHLLRMRINYMNESIYANIFILYCMVYECKTYFIYTFLPYFFHFSTIVSSIFLVESKPLEMIEMINSI